MLNGTERRRRFREFLAGDRLVPGPNIWDPITARISEDLGFEVAFLTAHGVEWAVNGSKEMTRATLTEFADQARRIYRASNLPIMVAGPLGFGNAINYMRAVEEFELAGVACLSIGDVALPMRYGEASLEIDRAPKLSLDAMLRTFEAALAARREPDFVIAARTNVVAIGDTDEAMRRVRAYEAAGVDAIWLTIGRAGGTGKAIDDAEDVYKDGVRAVHAATKLPLIAPGSPFRSKPHTDPELQKFLLDNGVRLASMAFIHFDAMVKAAHDTLKALRDGTKTHVQIRDNEIDRDLTLRTIRDAEDDELLERYLGARA